MVKVVGINGLTIDVPASVLEGLIRSGAVAEASVDLGNIDTGAPEDVHTVAPFDPKDHTVDEVEAYLETVDDGEYLRVIEAEKAGKNRKAVVSLLDESDGE